MKGTRMKQLAFFFAITVSLTAQAGKAEREFLKTKLGPAMKQAEVDFKKSCGCPITFVLADSTTKAENDMFIALHVVETFSRNAEGYCVDADSRKAACQLRTLEIGKADKASFSFKAGRGITLHDGQSYLGWDQIMREIDK